MKKPQTIRQRKALAKTSAKGKAKPDAAECVKPDRISVTWAYDGWPLLVRVYNRQGGLGWDAKNYSPEPKAAGQAEALPDPKARLPLLTRIKSWFA